MECTLESYTSGAIYKILSEGIDLMEDDRNKVVLKLFKTKKLIYNVKLLKSEGVNVYRGYVRVDDDLYFPSTVNCDCILVNIGYQMYLEMTLDEAVEYYDGKYELLKSQLDQLSKKIAEKRAHLYIMEETIKSLRI